jgi:hypothetical protein
MLFDEGGVFRVKVRDHQTLNRMQTTKIKILYDWRFTANQIVLTPSSLRITTRDFFDIFFATEPFRLGAEIGQSV